MSLALTNRRGLALNALLAVNGIHSASSAGSCGRAVVVMVKILVRGTCQQERVAATPVFMEHTPHRHHRHLTTPSRFPNAPISPPQSAAGTISSDTNVEDAMFAQLIASRAPRRRSPAGFAASIALHGIIVTGAVLVTSHPPMQRAPHAQLVVPYVAPVTRPHPVTQTPPGVAPRVAVPSVINVPVTVPDVIPPVTPLRAVVNIDDPFVFRVGVLSHAGTAAPVAADDPDTAFLDSQVEVQVALDTRSPMPRYPQLLRDAGVEGATLVRFVVDTLGRVEQGTVKVVESTHPAFALAVQAVLPQMRFSPARVGEKKVRQLVEFPLQFRLKR